MPIHPDLRPHYGWRWRTVTRPGLLKRAFGRFDERHYLGAAKCEREGCGYIDCLPKGRSELDVAHLVIPPGEPGHDDPTNLAVLCRKCHRAFDYEAWAVQYRAWLKRQIEERIDRLDSERPILQMLSERVS